MSEKFDYEHDILFEENALILGKSPNIYSALVRKADFTKNVPFHNIPYLKGKEVSKYIKQILKMKPKYIEDKHIKIRRLLKRYMKQNYIKQWRDYKKWFDDEIYPLTLIRIISSIQTDNINEQKIIMSNFFLKAEKIVNSKGEGNLNVPKSMNDLLNENKAYFIGASFGDGCNLSDQLKWQITDGHKNQCKLKYSYQYLKTINDLLYKEFGIVGSIKKYEGKKYILTANNKWFCRLINFFYGVPFGKKKYLKTPEMFKNDEMKKAFWSGIIDTDGEIFNNSANVQLCMKSENIVNEFDEYLNELKIGHKLSFYRDASYIFIPVSSFKKFNENFTINHPLKKMLVDNNLKNGSHQKMLKSRNDATIKNFLSINKNNFKVKCDNNQVKFGFSNGNFVRIPLDQKLIDGVAHRIRPTSRKIYITNRGNEDVSDVVNRIENMFDIKLGYHKSRNTYCYSSDVLYKLFKYLYKYEKPW